MKAKPKGPNGVTRQAVLDYLVREADLDGLVTVSEREVADALGLNQKGVSRHIHNLAADGLLEIRPAAAGYTSMNAIQLADEVSL